MQARVRSVLAYTGAGVSLAVAACTPFVLTGVFAQAVARTGVRVDPVYTGGALARTLLRDGYQIDIYRPVAPHALQNSDPFVQIAFKPVRSLPRHVSDDVDLDGDSHADVRVKFTVPSNPIALPTGEIVALNKRYQSFRIPPREVGLSALMARTGDSILVRIPMKQVPSK
ncbi:MAG: hypothetical protein ACLGXA_09735 [Acidobacteriota bacterium]